MPETPFRHAASYARERSHLAAMFAEARADPQFRANVAAATAMLSGQPVPSRVPKAECKPTNDRPEGV